MTERPPVWRTLEEPGPERAVTAAGEIRRGSRVRLTPRGAPTGRSDVMDLALAGKTARVEGLDQDQDGAIHVSVVLDEDPGRDLGDGRFPGHRFFFALEEVELLEAAPEEPARRLLVAGVGNLFLGDDGFGVAVARRLAELQSERPPDQRAEPPAEPPAEGTVHSAQSDRGKRSDAGGEHGADRQADGGAAAGTSGRDARPALPTGVDVADFGIRGMDLVYALNRGYDGVVLLDALPRGEPPGTLTVLEPEVPDGETVFLDTHGMDPARVLRFARQLGPVPEETVIVGCEPSAVPAAEPTGEDMTMELSAPVQGAAERAVELVRTLADRFMVHGRFHPAPEDGDAAPAGGSADAAAGATDPDSHDGGDPCAS